ncbi:MAG: hypothetical protein JWL84_2840 [Rhodospirillales bacterium]|nr:hypothetical protein [Rhodospirillales bacterium]
MARHSCLAHLNSDPYDRIWRFSGPGHNGSVRVDGQFHSNSALALRKAALAGLGIALLPEYCIEADFAAGTLAPVLPLCTVGRPVVALYPRSPHIPQKVRLLIDFLVKWFKHESAHEGRVARSITAAL